MRIIVICTAVVVTLLTACSGSSYVSVDAGANDASPDGTGRGDSGSNEAAASSDLTCAKLGTNCQTERCCSGTTCNAGMCCMASGQKCNSGADCCSGLPCTSGECCLPPQSACQSNSDCCGDVTCVEGTCCKAYGKPCATHADCCAGYKCLPPRYTGDPNVCGQI